MTSRHPIHIAVVGAGMIGHAPIEPDLEKPDATPPAIVDPQGQMQPGP